MAQLIKIGTATPVGSLVPDFIGQIAIDTTADEAYIATGLTNADWWNGGSGGSGGGAGFGAQDVTLSAATGGTLTVNVAQPYVVYTGVFGSGATVNCPAPADPTKAHRVKWVFLNGCAFTPGTGWPTGWWMSSAPTTPAANDALIFEWVPQADMWMGYLEQFV
jgi:hypothetical protein